MKHLIVILIFISTFFCSLFPSEKPSIPLLDMQDYYSLETRPTFIKKLSDAFQNLGFVAIINTGVSEDTVNIAYKRLRDFFSLDPTTKENYQITGSNSQRGYIPLLKETRKDHSAADFKEFLMFGRVLPYYVEEELGYGHNVWPKEVDLKSAIGPLYEELNQCSIPLLSALSIAMNQKEDFFLEKTFNADTSLRAIYYPATTKNPNNHSIWAKGHTDMNLITIKPKATAKGLEILDKNGEWIPVSVPENACIINVGDQLQNITNGYFRSCFHRVVSSLDSLESDRLSINLLVHPRNSSDLSPTSKCIEKTGGKAKYPTANRQELVMERLAETCDVTPELLKSLAESKIVERMIDLNKASPKVMNLLKEKGLASEKVLDALKK